MKIYVSLATLVVVTLTSQAAYPWGAEGHQTVALIAQSILKSQSAGNDAAATKTLDAINTILGSTAISDAATWPDEVKELSRACNQSPYVKDPGAQSSAICDAYRATAQWHFTNIAADQGQTEYSYPPKATATDPKGTYADGDLVIITRGLAHILRGEAAPTLDDVTSFSNWKTQCLSKDIHNCKKETLEFLIHFIGDIHQPLHSGAKCDIGGNDQYVTLFSVVGDKTAPWCAGKGPPCGNYELHAAWDINLLVKNAFVATANPQVPPSFSSTYAANLVTSLAGKTSSSDKTVCMKTSPSLAISQDNIDEASGPNNGPMAWVNESACYLPQIYSFPDDAAAQSSNKKKVGKRSVAQSSVIPNLCMASRKTGSGNQQSFTAFAIGQKYYDLNIVTINERLYWGGLRLANTLKYIYGDGDKVQSEIK